MEGLEPGEYKVTVGETVKSDRKGKETYQVCSRCMRLSCSPRLSCQFMMMMSPSRHVETASAVGARQDVYMQK